MNKLIVGVLLFLVVIAGLYALKVRKEYAVNTETDIQKIRDNFSDPKVKDLAEAIFSGDEQKIKELAATGVDLDTVGKFEYTPLRLAIKAENPEVLKLLLSLGTNPNFRAPEGTIAAHWAAANNDSTYLQILLDAGLDPNILYGTRSIIFSAVDGGYWKNYEILVESGANYLTAKAADNSTVGLYLASGFDYKRLEDYIKEGGDVVTPTKTGLSIVEILVKDQNTFGGDPNHPSYKYRAELLEMLREKGIEIPSGIPGVSY